MTFPERQPESFVLAPDDSIRTASGRTVYPLRPRAEDLSIFDIAHALSHLCRFTGHTSVFYSVAEHSLRVLNRTRELAGPSRGLDLWALLHDASEAYLCDLPRPLKRTPEFGALYRFHERRLMAAVCQRFGLAPAQPNVVHIADADLLVAEQRDLMQLPDKQSPVGPIVPGGPPALIRQAFLSEFFSLAPSDPEAQQWSGQ